MTQPTAIQQHVVGRPFKPGQSGNPSGRPKGAERLIREAVEARNGGWLGLANAMLDMAYNQALKPVDRQRAIEFLWDRVYGRPVQPSTAQISVSAGGGQRAPAPHGDVPTSNVLDAYAVLRGQPRAPSKVIDARCVENKLPPADVGVTDVDANAATHSTAAAQTRG